jgi:hypothetical protein
MNLMVQVTSRAWLRRLIKQTVPKYSESREITASHF